jgi:hypothetical protein
MFGHIYIPTFTRGLLCVYMRLCARVCARVHFGHIYIPTLTRASLRLRAYAYMCVYVCVIVCVPVCVQFIFNARQGVRIVHTN